jgi:predicted RNA methylase
MTKKIFNRKLNNDTEYLIKLYRNYGELSPNIVRQRKKFVPEIEPQIIDYDQELFNKFFPKDKNINFENLQLSNIGAYSISDPDTAQMISDIIKKYSDKKNIIVTDANANMGGNSINFAQNFEKVNSVEIIKKHCEILENNLKTYKLLDKVNIVCEDYLDVMMGLKQDVVFFDPPWGGPEYKKIRNLNLKLDEVNIIDIINEIKSITEMVVLRVPFNFDILGLLRRVNYENVNIVKIYGRNKFIRFYIIVLKKK